MLIGVELDKKNPEFDIDNFLFWMPQFSKVINDRYFEKLKNIANNKIYKSIYGSDWEYAMSLCIAHYMELLGQNHRIHQAESFKDLSGGSNYKGVMNSMTVGSFSKSIEVDKTLVTSEESFFWNQTSYGASLMALYKTKAVPSIFVITEN